MTLRGHTSFAFTLALVAAACGGSVSSTPSEASSTEHDAGAASVVRDGGKTCSARPGCASLTHCSDSCGDGRAWASTCDCVDGSWQCGSNTCSKPPPPASASCPPTKPPKVGTACDPNLTCDYGECQPQCRCNGGKWECSSDDCVPARPACPTQVNDGDVCTSILQTCEYELPDDKRGCTCAIDKKWVCVFIN